MAAARDGYLSWSGPPLVEHRHRTDEAGCARRIGRVGGDGRLRPQVGQQLRRHAQGEPLRDSWQVLAQYDTADSKLTTRRIWLHGERSGHTALLLSYGAAGRAPSLALPVGLALDAELVPHAADPASRQLRADLGEQFTAPVPTTGHPPGLSPAEATARYGDALRDDPWLDTWPVTLDRVVPVPNGPDWQLADAEGETALPLAPSAVSRAGLWRLVALSGGAPLTVFGECGHRGFTPLAAWPHARAETVRL